MQQPWTLRLILNAAALEAARPILLFSDWRKRVSSLTNCSHSRFLTSALRTLTWIFFETKTVIFDFGHQIFIISVQHFTKNLAVNSIIFDGICSFRKADLTDQLTNFFESPFLEWLASTLLARWLARWLVAQTLRNGADDLRRHITYF
jgi:hypothetical protein